MPRMFIYTVARERSRATCARKGNTVGGSQLSGARTQVLTRPAAQNEQAPDARPTGAMIQEARPRSPHLVAIEKAWQRWSHVVEFGCDFTFQRPAQPVLPWQRKGTLPL